MFFDLYKIKLKKLYREGINYEITDIVFKHGENEFIFVGKILKDFFPENDIVEMIRFYCMGYSFYRTESGNCYTTYNFLSRKNQLDDEEIYTLLAIIMLMNIIQNFDYNYFESKAIEFKQIAKDSVNTVVQIDNNIEKFSTKSNDKAGTMDNPLLVAGCKGVREYFESLKAKYNIDFDYDRTGTVYLTDEELDIHYAIDEYSLTDVDSKEVLLKIWINIYGVSNTNVYINNFMKKEQNLNEDVENNNKQNIFNDEKYSTLLKLKYLLDKKIITEEEYNEEKRKILDN